MADGVFPSKDGYYYVLNGRRGDFRYKTSREAAKKYIENLLIVKPKYKELFKGKSWSDIFRLAGVKID